MNTNRSTAISGASILAAISVIACACSEHRPDYQPHDDPSLNTKRGDDSTTPDANTGSHDAILVEDALAGPSCSQTTCGSINMFASLSADFQDYTPSQVDKDSDRRGRFNLCMLDGTPTYVLHELCDLGETCANDNTCVGCGSKAKVKKTATADGKMVQECIGCHCLFGELYNCFAAGKLLNIGVPVADWYLWKGVEGNGSLGVRLYIAEDGTVFPVGTETTGTASKVKMNLAPGGAVEFDAVVDWTGEDNYGVKHTFHATGHFAGTCPK